MPRVLPDHDVWDSWPVQEENGRTVLVGGAELWMTLAAPAVGHPEDRHDRARLRLLARTDGGWHDCGDVFADGASLGTREWSGSAVHRPDGTVSIFYTAAGLRGASGTTYHQRVVEAWPRLSITSSGFELDRDVEHRVVLHQDEPYLPADDVDGGPGRIRAFRDPGWFRDPVDGREYLLVAASVPGRDRFRGAVAIARATADGWQLLPPLVVAEDVNHELERPHIVVHRSRYYLFFCTAARSFHPRGSAPSGLYGFVASSPIGPYQPLNGSGLVVRNPPERPEQAYAWIVLPDLRVESFLNYPYGLADAQTDAQTARARFGGTAAPGLDLVLHETGTSLVFDH